MNSYCGIREISDQIVSAKFRCDITLHFIVNGCPIFKSTDCVLVCVAGFYCEAIEYRSYSVNDTFKSANQTEEKCSKNNTTQHNKTKQNKNRNKTVDINVNRWPFLVVFYDMRVSPFPCRHCRRRAWEGIAVALF